MTESLSKPENDHEKWLNWAIELQFIAQAGLTYSRDSFDLERFQRIRDIAAEIMAARSGLELSVVKNLFCNETGFQTPKLDTRAAIFKNDRILLVREQDGLWSLPGGWVDVNCSIRENTVKEVREEAGLEVTTERLIAVQDRNRHNTPQYAYGICKVFVLCKLLGGKFMPNSETTASGFFPMDELPPLSEAKNTAAQIRLCFEAARDENWHIPFD